MYNATQRIFNAWAVKQDVRRLHINLTRARKLMQELGIDIPRPGKIVKKFLKSAELPEY